MNLRYSSFFLASILALSGCGGGSSDDSSTDTNDKRPIVNNKVPNEVIPPAPDFTFSNEMAADEGEDVNQYISAPARVDMETGKTYKVLPIFGTHLGNLYYSDKLETTKIFHPEDNSYLTIDKGDLATRASFEDLMEDKNPSQPHTFNMLSGNFIDTSTNSYKLYKGKREAELLRYNCFRALTLGEQEISMQSDELSNVITHLNDNPLCKVKTEVIAINLSTDKNKALSDSGVTIKPYLTQEISWGKTMAWIGVAYSDDMIGTTNLIQQTINELSLKGIHHIGLLSAMGAANDKTMLNSLTEVDVVLGNLDNSVKEIDFSELKADLNQKLSDYHFEMMNRKGQKVCMSYNSNKIFSSSYYEFETDIKGEITNCESSVYLYVDVDEPDTRYNDEVYSFSDLNEYLKKLNDALSDFNTRNEFHIIDRLETNGIEKIRQIERNYPLN